MINNFLPKLSIFKHDFIYDLISYQQLNLCLDVGAAAGMATKRIKMSGSKDTKIIAFEPFEGNHDYFYKNTQEFTNIQLIKKAVSKKSEIADFFVPSVVTGNEKGWENMPGYSSVGFLIKEQKQNKKEEQKHSISILQRIKQGVKIRIKQILKQTPKTNIQENRVEIKKNYNSIETVAIDDVINKHIDFMKIDVQGGEYEVLKGSENTIKKHGIDLIYLEFSGDTKIIDFLYEQNYLIFDTDYVIIPKVDTPILEDMGFYDLKTINLSTGVQAYTAKLILKNSNYCHFLKEFNKNFGYIQTDLICVHSSFLDNFMIHLNTMIQNS